MDLVGEADMVLERGEAFGIAGRGGNIRVGALALPFIFILPASTLENAEPLDDESTSSDDLAEPIDCIPGTVKLGGGGGGQDCGGGFCGGRR